MENLEASFQNYLTAKGYNAATVIVDNKMGGIATFISQVPSLADFSYVKRLDDGTYWARLTTQDFQNESITGGLFE